MVDGFVEWEVRAPSAEAAERAAAEAFAAGAAGLEERAEGLHLYAERGRARAVEAALRDPALARDGVVVGPARPVEARDWSTAWREGLRPVVVSPRLGVRPPFAPATPEASCWIEIEPGQAFGTGGHASTRLALSLLDARPLREGRLLDVGTGSGVLALAALALGCAWAVGVDCDPLAASAARGNARRNRLEAGLSVVTGSLDALAPGVRFERVVANLLRSELEPLLDAIVRAVAARGELILSGLLESEGDRLEAALADRGLCVVARRVEADPSGDAWLGLAARAEGPPA